MAANNLAVYVHYPFCKSKCPYCDFNSHVRDGVDDEAWRTAYLRELEYFKDSERNITSIFFGGGTPSLMPAKTTEAIINKIDELWGLDANCEITLEANPTSVEYNKFQDFRSAGVNRVSIGVQSFDEAELKFLGREHNANEARQAIEYAAKIFDRYSFDLIYALPDQKLDIWEKQLTEALKLADKHISLYQLTIEPGTNFFHNKVPVPEEGLAADFYELTQEICENAGLPAYEVSNHASIGEESRHNLTYWRYQDYLGIGPGAHGRIAGHASVMRKSPEKWLEQVAAKGNGLEIWEKLSERDQFEERIMMGLRLIEGIDANKIAPQNLIELGFLEIKQQKIRATKKGMLILNTLITKLLETS